MTSSPARSAEEPSPPTPGRHAVDDHGPAAPRRLLVERTVLDEQMAALRQADARSWGLLSWLGPLISLVVLVVGESVLAATVLPRSGTARAVAEVVVLLGGELLLLAALLAFGRPIAARGGGWRAALGLDRIRGRDWLPWIIGLGVADGGRGAVGTIAAALSDGKAAAEASNLRVGHPTVVTVVTLVLTVVILAPIAEELMFRGLLLRSFMRRMSFWPAAALSTALFGLFHVYEVDTVVGAVTLACSVAALGLSNCFLVRITGRLTPGIMVHACINALAVAVALLAAA